MSRTRLAESVCWLLLSGACQANHAGICPAVSDIEQDEVVVLFPALGYPAVDGGGWEIRVWGWIFEPRDGAVAAFSALGRSLDLDPRERLEYDLFIERARRFIVDNEGGKHLVIRLGGKRYTLEPSKRDGSLSGALRLSAEDVARLRAGQGDPDEAVPFQVVMPADDPRTFGGRLHLMDGAGVSVVSDIDDTIKITSVRDKEEVLKNTFIRPFRAVPGMAELYQSWARRPGTGFHYVSASPWQLYESLETFRASAGYPAGTYHLRTFNWTREGIERLTEDPGAHKRPIIENLLRTFPRRRFMLVGDSGERDPEIYASIARSHPGQVLFILIRDVTGQPSDDPRYRELFGDVPADSWQVFREPAEVRFEMPPP